MTSIFADTAPACWAAQLPVIPLWPGQKRPILLEWQQFANRMPTEQEQHEWLLTYPDSNVGLPLGPASGLVALDIDSVDPSIVEAIESVIQARSPWRRVGAKGYVAVFKWAGEKTFRIKDQDKKTLCELLCAGTQVVLPPSIHPDTGRPYSANCELLDVLKQVPPLPRDFERTLRAALQFKGVKLSVSGSSAITEWTPRSSRDTRYTAVSGTYARDVVTGKRKLLEAIRAVEEWPRSFTEQVEGDNLDPSDGVSKLVRFILRDVREKGYVLVKGWDEGLTDEQRTSLGIDFTADEQEQDYDTILAELRQGIETAKSDAARIGVVETALRRVVRSPSISGIQYESLLRAIAHLSGTKTTLAALKKQVQTMRHNGREGTSHGEIADYIKSDFPNLRFWGAHFWDWEGSHWRVKEPYEMEIHIVENYGNFPVCKRDNDYKAVLKTTQTKVTTSLADVQVRGINFANGFLTENLELVDHNAGYGMTYVMPYRYLAESREPSRFLSFLEDCWGHDADFEDKKLALQEAMCATLFGIGTKLSRVFLLLGAGHSGKSVLLNIIQGLFPDEQISAVSPNDWGDKYQPAQMVGKTLNIGGELHEKRKIDGQVFKQVVVGEPITAQLKNQQLFKFNPLCAHWFASNHPPQSDDTSDGFYRRWLIFEFNRRFPEERKNIHLAEEITAEERELIAAWAVKAMPRIKMNNRYTLPASHDSKIKEVLAGQDSVYFFIQRCPRIQLGPTIGPVGKNGDLSLPVTPVDQLHDLYLNFIVGQGAKPVLLGKFSLQMRSLAPTLGYQVVMRDSARGFPEVGFIGITIQPAGSQTSRSSSNSSSWKTS